MELDALLIGDFNESDKPRYRHFQQNLQQFKNTCQRIVDEHKKARESGDYEKAPFLDTLLDHYGHDDEFVVAQTITFVVGGFHTTGNFLTWLFHYLACNQEVQDKVLQEVNEVVGKDELKDGHIKKLM